MTAPIHFYLTFNPFLNQGYDPGFTQAHEFYEYLKDAIKKDSNSYAYWGKMIAKDRESKLDIAPFSKIIETNNQNGHATHLYITDFTNLWVGKVIEVKKNIGQDFKTLSFYKDKNVDVWFKITDFYLLEYTSEETASKLSELYIDNEYNELKIMGLSPFTTAIKYPAIIHDLSEEMYFDEAEEKLILKFRPAVNNSSVSKVIKNLHDYSFPESMYAHIPVAAKSEIESAEIDMFEQRHHNMPRIAFSYLKALEIVVNDLVIHHLKRKGFGENFFVKANEMPPKLYLEDPGSDGVVTLGHFHRNYSIGQILYFIERCQKSNNFMFKKAFADHVPFLNFLMKDFARIIKENKLIEIRGVLAHNDTASVSDKDFSAIRNLILGVGCKGLIYSLYETFYFKDFQFVAQVKSSKVEEREEPKKTKLKLVS